MGVHTTGALYLRETAGTSGLEQTLRSAVAILAHYEIPHLVVGGLAVQEHGYFRVTIDADLVVPDVQEAVLMVTADLSGPFVPYRGNGTYLAEPSLRRRARVRRRLRLSRSRNLLRGILRCGYFLR
jgi:hypothetical protein